MLILTVCLLLCNVEITLSEDATSECPADGPCNKNIQSKRRIIFDSDPGLDDAFALLWLLEGYKDDLYRIEGLTAVQNGEIPSYDIYRNIFHMVNISLPTPSKQTKVIRTKLKSIPIAKYNDDSKEFVASDSLTNPDGFYGLSQIFNDFPSMFSSSKKVFKSYNNNVNTLYSEDLLIEKILLYPHEISIICAGPVTNLYLAELKHPGIISLVKDIYIMGGVLLESGDSNPLSESNFEYDSESLYNLFRVLDGNNNPPNVFIFPLDITRNLQWHAKQFQLLYSLLNMIKQNEIELCRMKIEGIEDDVSEMYDINENDLMCSKTGILHYFLEKSTEKMIIESYIDGIGEYMELNDLAMIGFIKYPHLFDFKYIKCYFNKENGMIWYDQRQKINDKNTINLPNCFVAVNVDSEKFIKVFVRDLLLMLNNL